MAATAQAQTADRRAVQLAEGEGMVTEQAKVSRVTPPPLLEPEPRARSRAESLGRDMSIQKNPNRSVVVTFDEPAQARRATARMLADPAVPNPVGVEVHTQTLMPDRVELRHTQARLGAGIGAFVVGSALAVIGGIAAFVGALSVSVPVGVLAGLVLGTLYGTLAGALAGSTELMPRLERLRKRLAQGKSAVRVEMPVEGAARAERVLFNAPGADRTI